MHQHPYSYNKKDLTQYIFVSKGKRGAITKIVQFTPTSIDKIFNLGFGDMLSNGEIDDTANSNNDDIGKVLTTVVSIIKDFTKEYPDIKIVFAGNTIRKTELYHRILKSNYSVFKNDFIITVLQNTGNNIYKEVVFDPDTADKYSAFFVKRK